MLLAVLILGCHWVSDEELQAKLDPDGDGAQGALDCGPRDPNIFPGADEVCDGIDNDCDGLIDQEDDDVDLSTVREWFPDVDGDGYGVNASSVAACSRPPNHVDVGGDCDDSNASISPEGVERCNGEDDDCDGDTDEDADDASTWYRDADEDGYGDAGTMALACDAPDGFTANADDCDDSTARIHPDHEEICNDGVDNNCDDALNDCLLSGERSLADADVVIQGGGGRFGETLVSDDFDGDGIPDLAVSAPTRGNDDRGLVFLYQGPITEDLGASDALQVQGLQSDGHFGASMAAVGDVDADGAADLLVGAEAVSDGSGNAQAGAAYLLTAEAWASEDLADARVVLYGVYANNSAGAGVAGVGDRTGLSSASPDGVVDLIVGSPDYNNGSATDTGELCLISGTLTGVETLRSSRMCLYGVDPYDRLGGVVAGVGDVNGDGLPDLVAGTPGRGAGGAAWLIVTPGNTYLNIGNASGATELVGASGGDALGSTAAGVGDVTGDGYEDLLLGAPGQDGGGVDAGAAYLVAGGATQPARGASVADVAEAYWVGESSADQAGAAVSGAGDVDGDGHADMLIGSPFNSTSSANTSGRSYLVLGPPSGSGGLDLSNAQATFDGVDDHDASGASLTAVGDINGDGYPDFAIGAPDIGDVYLIFGLGL